MVDINHIMNPQGNNKYRHSIKEFNANTPKSYIGCFCCLPYTEFNANILTCVTDAMITYYALFFLSLFCVIFYYFEDFGNIPIHSYITKVDKKQLLPPVAKFYCFPQTNVETQEALFPTVLHSDITAVILTRMTENTEFISDLNSNFGNLL